MQQSPCHGEGLLIYHNCRGDPLALDLSWCWTFGQVLVDYLLHFLHLACDASPSQPSVTQS